MLRGLWKLTWLEIKIFIREPLGLIGSLAFPVIIYLVAGRMFGPSDQTGAPDLPRFIAVDLPVFGSILIALSAVLSLVAIIAIYREGGILKRLRATPLRPYTILTAHVLVKLLSTALTMGMMILVGRRYFPIEAGVPIVSYMLALLLSTVTILSLGFLIASLVPTARFAQPLGTFILYPMIGLSGLFFPLSAMPQSMQWFAHLLPLTYVVSLLRGIWSGEGWLHHMGDVAILIVSFGLFTALSTRVFRWE